MAQWQLDLLKVGPGGSAEFRAGAACVVGRNAWDSGSRRVWAQHLPDNLLGQHVALYLVASVDGPEHVAVYHAGWSAPGIDGHLDPNRHRHRADAPVLAVQIDDAPAAIPLLHVPHRKRGDLGPAQGAAQQHGDYGAVAQPL